MSGRIETANWRRPPRPEMEKEDQENDGRVEEKLQTEDSRANTETWNEEGSPRNMSGPVPPLSLLKGTHHCSKKRWERVFILPICMSLILGKRVPFFRKCQQFRKKGVFLSHFHWKRGIFWCFKSAFFEKRGLFFLSKYQWKGSFFYLKNDHTSPLLHVSGRTGMSGRIETPNWRQPCSHQDLEWRRKTKKMMVG